MKLEDLESTFTSVYIVAQNVTQIFRIVYEIKYYVRYKVIAGELLILNTRSRCRMN